MKTNKELPCEDTGKACEWLWDSDEQDADLYCQNCYRSRDWELGEFSDE